MKKGCKTYWRHIFCIFLLFIGVLNADAQMANLTEIENHFIPNIKIIRDENLKVIENPELHMGVSMDNIILRDILNKGMGAISRTEINSLRQKWMPLEFQKVTEAKSSYPWAIISGVALLLLIMIFSIVYLWRVRGDKKTILILLIILLFGLVCAEFAAIKIYVSKNEAISLAKLLRIESLRIVDHLRQTSDDLTRMVRLFAVTGDSRFEAYFKRILDIRNGEAPRPVDYGNGYWDYVVATGRDPRGNGTPMSIEDLMIQKNFDNEELNLLRTAKNNSNKLAVLELRAINAVKGFFADDTGAYGKKGRPDLEFAQKLLYGNGYHRAKAGIMATIDSVSLHVDKRTNQTISQLNIQARELIFIASVIGFGSLLIVGVLLFLSAKWISSSQKEIIGSDLADRKNLKGLILSSLVKSWPLLLTSLLVAFLITSLSWRNMLHLVDHERGHLKESLESVLQMTTKATENWFNEREQEIRIWAHSPKLSEVFQQLSIADNLKLEPIDEELSLAYQSILLAVLKPLIVEQGYLGYLIVNAAGKVLGSDRSLLVGSHLDSPEEQSFLEQAMEGPNYSAISLPNRWIKKGYSLENRAMMMSSALIRTPKEFEPGVLIFLIDPEKEFTEILQAGRIGTSGESYAFNRQGQLISESRFDNNLRDIGLIGPAQRGILNIAIRDPGGNMLEGFVPKAGLDQQALTLMAASAIRGQTGLNLDGYNDYRGVLVIGAWIWNEAFGFGLTTEMDVAEAYISIKNIKRQTLGSILISLGLLLIMTAIFVWGRIRTSMANDKLRISEHRISEQLAYQSALLDAIPNPIFVKDQDTVFTSCNQAYEKVFGVSRELFVGKTVLELNHLPKQVRNAFQWADLKLLEEKGFTKEELTLNDGENVPREMMYFRQTFDNLDGQSSGLIGVLIDITDRKKAETAVAVAEEKSRLLLESVGDGIFGVGNDGLVNFINSAGLRMLGIESQDVIGKEIHPIIHHTKADGSPYPVNDCPMYQSFTQGVDNHIHDEVLWRKDGTSFPVEYSSVPIKKENDIIGSVVIFRDITLRKQNEEELKKLSMAVEQSMVSVVITNPKGRIEYVNAAFTKTTGYSSEEAVGQNPRILNAGIRSKEFYKKMWDTISGGNVWQGEFANRKKNGDIFWENASISPVRNDKEQITHYVAVKDDITERRQAQEALRDNEETLSKITSSALSAIIMISSETGEISFWNQAAENIFGWKAREVVGKKLHQLIIPDQYQHQHMEGLKQFRQEGKGALIGHPTETSAINRDGVEFPVELSLSAVKLKNKWNAIGLITDITQRKQAEQELKEAKELAEEATRAKSDFLANMSHEIRTPMNAIIGMSHLCMGTDLEPRQKDYIEKVYSSAHSLLGIINDILDFSKIEAGKLEMESIPFRLDEVLDNLGNLTALKAQEKGLELLFDTHPDVPRALVGDPLRLGQILLNLAGNAVKFTEEGEIVVRTEPVKITDKEVEVRITVKDSGIGMTNEQVKRLFQSFSQADTSTTRKYGGTGLGLTISKKLTELMKGRIWVESEPGSGSSFIFTAMFGRAHDLEVSIEHARPADMDQLKVLVVDDVESARHMLEATLASFSFRVICVDSGQAALDVLETAPIDDPFQLVLMDWRMPGMDGIEASRLIKGHPSLPNIPTIIMVTAYGREEVMLQAEKAGLEGFLIKPMTPSTLLDTIMQVFGNKGGLRLGGRSDKEWKIETNEILLGCHVLVAEDNKINQQVAEELLTQAGLRVSIANNGKEAVEKVRQESFDAVLMDMQMPEMDGFEATKILRSNPEFADLPIIAMTANAMAQDREKCIDAGMNDHIPKPIDPDKLFQTLSKWISNLERGPYLGQSSAHSADEQVIPLPVHIDGVDLPTGLRRVGGNKTLYRNLMIEFHQNHGDDIKILEEKLDQGDFTTAQRMVHTLKGVAGGIGAHELFKLAQDAETGIKKMDVSEDIDNKAPMEALSREFDLVMQSLAKLAETNNAGTSAARVQGETKQIKFREIESVLLELETLMEEMDPDAEEKVRELEKKLEGSCHRELMRTLSGQVGGFDFDEAQGTLSKLITLLKKDK